MKTLFLLVSVLSSFYAYGQNRRAYSDSAPINLAIGASSYSNGQSKTTYNDSAPINLSIGSSHNANQKYYKNAESISLTIGLETNSAGSNPLQLKVGVGEPVTPTVAIAAPTERIVTNTIADKTSNSIEGSPQYYGLFIGIDNYKFSSVDLPNLDKPLQDATTLQQVLIDKYSLTTANSTLLKNPTRADVLNALENLSQKVTAKDNLLVFYAGHGVWDERLKVGYWLPSDAKISSKGNWLSNSTIRDYIAGIDTKHTLLITDACFSGSIFKTRGANADISGYGISKIYKLPSRKAMTSGTLTTVPDESKFMHYLIKRLNENTSKYLTTRQLFFSLETAVLNNTSTVPQLGVIQDTGDEGGDFIFIKKE